MTERESSVFVIDAEPSVRKVLARLVRRVANRFGLGDAELSAGGRRKTVWTGRWVVSHIAVRHRGHSVGEVARALGVSAQTVLRGVEQGRQIMQTQGWALDELISKTKVTEVRPIISNAW